MDLSFIQKRHDKLKQNKRIYTINKRQLYYIYLITKENKIIKREKWWLKGYKRLTKTLIGTKWEMHIISEVYNYEVNFNFDL